MGVSQRTSAEFHRRAAQCHVARRAARQHHWPVQQKLPSKHCRDNLAPVRVGAGPRYGHLTVIWPLWPFTRLYRPASRYSRPIPYISQETRFARVTPSLLSSETRLKGRQAPDLFICMNVSTSDLTREVLCKKGLAGFAVSFAL